MNQGRLLTNTRSPRVGPRALMIGLLLGVLVPSAMARGKNKIPYENFEWKVYHSEHFKVYYYESAANLLPTVVDMSEAAYRQVSEKLQHDLNFKVPLIYFKTHEEFELTNIFPGFIPRAVGAFAEPFQSRMVLPFDQEPEKNYSLLTHELTHIFQYDMFYNNRISSIVRANAPTWFIEGMASYVADDEDNLDRMVLRDAAISSNFSSLGNFNSLSFIAYRIGHAAFKFIEEQYGIEGVRNFLWQYRKNITGNVPAAIERAFEMPVEDFDRQFRKYLRKRYVTLLPEKEEPDDYAREIRTRRAITTLSPELSPSGDLFAAIVPIKNELDLVLISTKDGRIFKNLTRGYTNRYNEINVGAFGGINDLAWSSDGNELVFSARKEGSNRLYIVNVLKGSIRQEVIFDGLRDAQSPVFSKDGSLLYFVGNVNGFYDVFSYNRDTEQLLNLTNDPHLDRNPRLSPDGKEVLYSSSRNGFFKVFVLDLAKGDKVQLTSGLGNDIQAAYSADMTSIYFASDRFDDIYNIYELDLESGVKKQYTNILTGAFSPQERVIFDHKEGEEQRQLIFTAYYQGRYRVYRMDKPEAREAVYDVANDNFANVKNYNMSANIELKDEQYKKYRLRNNFSISNVNVNVGATDDGRFISNSAISFSDTLGDHVLDITTYSVSSLENYYVNYLNRTRRLQWGASFQSLQEFFVDSFTFSSASGRARLERRYKNVQLGGYMRYPFSLFSRVDIGGGMSDQDVFRFIPNPGAEDDPSQPSFVFTNVDFTEPYAYINFSFDTLRYQRWGPQHGTALDVGVRTVLDNYETYSFDFRAYRELTQRSLIAFRTIYNHSDGDTPEFFALGGNNNLRGDYGYQEFVGSRRFLTQFELRFPLIDRLQFPGFAFYNIRGGMFVDAGGTWFEDFDFEWEFQDTDADPNDPLSRPWDPENPDPRYLLGAYGVEISMNLLGLDVHWTWAKRTNFDEFPSSSRFSFWIGRKF
ncbi:PD40 domain-containing protein [Acanthopleuribacter pedis]|uniref:PD40 domain-containing protein n=1 Tax=Acanthopleuribacter pedis TaxID=442870 RepID=A0A8J7Q7E3_9BACT|nr:PD40 domain-containing protein [Acanthopleuribacter pedis]MBO1318169.1 PD40 domain-containing protein [Acanthopleuribacter pedis]